MINPRQYEVVIVRCLSEMIKNMGDVSNIVDAFARGLYLINKSTSGQWRTVYCPRSQPEGLVVMCLSGIIKNTGDVSNIVDAFVHRLVYQQVYC